jgi:hypothetical protein
MIFGIQMYHEEMQVKFKYGCDSIIIEGIIAIGLRKIIENYSFHSFLARLYKVHLVYRMVNAVWAGGWASLIGYLCCVINSSYTFY